MSLISFPLKQSNVINKYYAIGPTVSISGGQKSEVNYIVMSDRNAIVTINFHASLVSESSGNINQIKNYPMTITDFLKAGDFIYALYTVTSSGGINPVYTFTWSYSVNGSTVHTNTQTFSAGSSAVDYAVSTTVHSLEIA
jgi:hypothetical protein